MLLSNQVIFRVYDTGDKPVLVEANDLNNYVCKHNNGQRIAYKLFAEWICHGLMSDLGLSLPPRKLVQIRDEHVLGSASCQIAFFKAIPSFATLHVKETFEWNQLSPVESKLILNIDDLLTIAFCDLWLANEDRNYGNFNLLLCPMDKGFEIMPIDHAACFNSLAFNVNRPLVQLSEDETLFDTPDFRNLVKPRIKRMSDANAFIESLYLRIPNLERKYEEHVLAIPKEWNIPKDYIAALKANMFHKDWLNETKTTFLTFIKSSLKIK